MHVWFACFVGLLLGLMGCVHRESIEKKLTPALECRGMELYFPKDNSRDPYRETCPDDLAPWEETSALLTYDSTLSHRTYLYRLSYTATLAEEGDEAPKDDDDKESDGDKDDKKTSTPDRHHITHFVKTHIPFPRFQTVKIRYYKHAPLLFEWVSDLEMCPTL
jgi:hypothetical protein